ncbi:ankyrin repeat and KH domain-containing protein mask-like isoform X2 [Haliotis rubra]|uniref:ankyrin repeat and KH domain-containing protein mask-like isoform X2 n=1 Tax=Haliotis rubra TaxID=36100 RepID=UPI001EE594D8|nr:ankyrin repeat and KH domain-containing protein mask-like isoform X2 [Haliotis rubra]
MEDIELKKDEIAKLEENVIPELKKQIEEAEIRLEVLKDTVEDTSNAIPALEKQVRDLIQNLTKYGTDVKAERESIAELYRLVLQLGNDLSDRKNDQKALAEKMQKIEVEQAKQKRRCEDELRKNIELQKQIQKLRKVIEEKDANQIKLEHQLKDARTAATESKVQEHQDAVQEKTTKSENGREQDKKVSGDLKTGVYQQAGDEAEQHGGKTGDCLNIVSAPVSSDLKSGAHQRAGDEAEQHGASSDVMERGTTGKVSQAGGSVSRQGVRQKDSDPGHVDDLLAACLDGNMAEVKRVLDLGQVDINCRGEWSWTPVMWAARSGHRDVVELLLSRGADVSLEDGGGNSILHWACEGGDVGTMEFLLSLNVVDVNCRGGSNTTPVMAAVDEGHRDMVELLLSRGADVSLVDEDGNNTLHLACYGGDQGTVELILSQNVLDVNCRGERNMTPVMMAAERGHRDVMELLLSRGADVSLVDGGGNNILHLACQGYDAGTVELILSLNVVDVNARNNEGQTAADVARKGGRKQLVDQLVKTSR